MMVRRDKVSTHKPLETAGTAGPLGEVAGLVRPQKDTGKCGQEPLSWFGFRGKQSESRGKQI